MILDLKQLSPAELLFLLNPNQQTGQNMMRLTLLDLLMKEVLQFRAITEATGKTNHFIEPSGYFSQYSPLIHEAPFLLPFKTGEQRLPLYLLIRTVKDHTDDFYGFQHRFVSNAPRIQALLRPSFWNVFHINILSNEGELLRSELKYRLKTGRRIVIDSLDRPDQKLQELPQLLGSGLLIIDRLEHVLRIKNYSVKWLDQLMEAYFPLKHVFQNSVTEVMQVRGAGDSAYYNIAFYLDDNNGSESDGCGSACGGDSNGCSGSGCSGGGCGGCGGD